MRPDFRSPRLASLFLLVMILDRARAQEPPLLTLREAQLRALANNPGISIAELRALAASEAVQETRAAFFPTLTFSATTAGAADENNTRIAAGFLNNPTVFDRNAEGISLSQVITDFGRTANLVSGARLHARAEELNAEATRAQIALQVSSAYFTVLQSQAVFQVAEQTVATRQLLLDQVTALAANRLRSDLDVGLARVSLEEGRLLRSRASNDVDGAYVSLSTLMGERQPGRYRLVDEQPPRGLATSADALVGEALSHRPDLVRFRYERDAAVEFARAERALHFPVISAVGAAGVVPLRDSHFKDNYAAAGVNLSLPLFNGFLFSARQREAELKASATEQTLRDVENNLIRDARVAWLNAQNALDRLTISQDLLAEARKTYSLAESRYRIGSSSFVELSQAQLNLVTAEIANARARFEAQFQQQVLRFQAGTLAP
jgi:outer membrane protein